MKKTTTSNIPYPAKEPEAPGANVDTTIKLLQQERKILLELGNDITKVREKNDLIKLFSQRVKSLYYFTHTIVTLIDHKDDSYTPFLLDHAASAISTHADYSALTTSHFSLNEPFIQAVLQADEPISFLLEEVMNEPNSPPFLKANYEGGIREILMTKLMNADQPMGFLHIYSNRLNSFTKEFREVIKGISPLLSNAVSNIIKNEEILRKESEKSYLLDFSIAIAAVRDRPGFQAALKEALGKINPLKAYLIRKIDDDASTMSTYIQDGIIEDTGNELLLETAATKYPINDGLQNRVLDSYIPLLFSIDMEIRRGITSQYLLLWKKRGLKSMAGIALRNGDTPLGILWLGIEEINIPLLRGICAQISIAMANIIANEEVLNKEKEKSFLLDFSNDIASVKTKADLQSAIVKVLRKMMHTKLAMIQVLDEDGIGLTPYMNDNSLFESNLSALETLAAKKINVREFYTAQVLKQGDAVVFDIDEELRNNHDSEFPPLWKTTGYKYMYASLLRVGNANIGTLWMMADHVSLVLFKGLCSQISVAIANIKANARLLEYKQQLEVENDYLKEQIQTIFNFTEIIGSGVAMQKVYQLMSLVATSNATVLVLGETGTGKELIARAIHNASHRKSKVMIKVNCAAMPANLIESELFGHERGAFTGAFERRIGKFELAHNGTLFLDEIGEMPMEAQVKLLRVIQERELERVGGKQTIKVDVRIVAATNRNLEEEVRQGRFRSDLFYRLNVFPIGLPPLRDRTDDIELLANFFLARYSKNTGRKVNHISPAVMQQLKAYLWPGNVRELEHLIERSVLLATDNILREIYLPRQADGDRQKIAVVADRSLNEMERSYIIEVLKRCRGKISGIGGAAEILAVPGNTLHSKMKKLAITKADYFSKND